MLSNGSTPAGGPPEGYVLARKAGIGTYIQNISRILWLTKVLGCGKINKWILKRRSRGKPCILQPWSTKGYKKHKRPGHGHVVIPGPLALQVMAKGDPPMVTALDSGAKGLGAEVPESQ
jgi:hypothetical protein